MTNKERLILAMNAGASALETHKVAKSMTYFKSNGGPFDPNKTIKYLDAAKILRDEAARLACDEGTVDNIRCPFCGELFDGNDATNYDTSCEYADCPHCGEHVHFLQSVKYTILTDSVQEENLP